MSDASTLEASSPPSIQSISISDVLSAFKSGFQDFKAAPAFGLFFALFFVLGGIVLFLEFKVMDQSYWIIPVAFGFPFLAPFLAVGLYEVSRRLETGVPLDWAQILGVVFNQKDRQFPSIAMVLIMGFLFWIFVAHIVFMLFMGLQPMTNITSNWQDALLNSNGITMLAVGTVVGGIMAFVAFALTVSSLPMLLDREMDFISAMIYSFQSVVQNFVPMVFWGALVTALMVLAMVPLFFGLFIVLPILGHATWHLYKKVMSFED